jgi:hypothetical protein
MYTRRSYYPGKHCKHAPGAPAIAEGRASRRSVTEPQASRNPGAGASNRRTAAVAAALLAGSVLVSGSVAAAEQATGHARPPAASQMAETYYASLAAAARSAGATATPIVLTADDATAPSGTSFEPLPGLTISLSPGGTITVTISADLREEITAALEAGESVSELIGSIIDAVPGGAGAAAGITAAALGLAAALWDEVSAVCTSQATDAVTFSAGPTQASCGDFRLTF